MFYLNARKGADNLSIDQSKPLYANVPAAKKDNMMLFEGKRMPDGSINWVNPQPLEKSLTTVDILKLDFYPPRYLDSLKKWGYNTKDKHFTDSLYYSFGNMCGEDMYTADTIRRSKAITLDEALMIKSDSTQKRSFDGKALFKMNCVVCHTMNDKKLTGPGLQGVTDRAPKGDWLFNYTKNCAKVLSSGDAYANKMHLENGGGMPIFEGALSDEQIRSIVAYISNGKAGMNITHEDNWCSEINPSRIRAIWNKRFNNTILATKEFEERLRVIFTTCNADVLNLYINNLNHNLSDIDAEAANMCSGSVREKFLEFAARKDGGVKIDNKQMEQLQNYVKQKKEIYDKAVTEARMKIYEQESLKDMKAFEERMKHNNKEWERINSLYQDEANLNLKEAFRQLGRPLGNGTTFENFFVEDNYYSIVIAGTGWKNVDAYVTEATVNRSTLNYTDTETGKKAVIKYQPILVQFSNTEQFDRTVAYLLPDKLSSFQRLKQEDAGFKENLNELMKYSVFVMGFKGEDIFWAEEKNVRPQNYTLKLTPISRHELQTKLNTTYPVLHPDMKAELTYQLFEQKEELRQRQIKKTEEFRRKVYYLVYPCAEPAATQVSAKPESIKAYNSASH